MITVNLTPEQAGILYDVIGEEFHKFADAYCEHTDEHKARTNLAYSAMCAIRTAREADWYDVTLADDSNPFLISKREYLLDRCLTDEDLAQQGIC